MVSEKLGKGQSVGIKIFYWIGYVGGLYFDAVAKITGRRFPISAVRIKKFCSNTQFTSSKISRDTGFVPPFTIIESVQRTIRHEFLDPHDENEVLFYTQ